MNAIVMSKTNETKYFGTVLFDGFQKLSLVYFDKNGSSQIRSFDKSKWIIRTY